MIIRYSPEQLFDVVAAVDFYHGFVPWCQRSDIIRHHPDGSFDAELEIGFKFLVESYVSHVELDRPKRIKVFNLHSRKLKQPSNECDTVETVGKIKRTKFVLQWE